MGGGGGGGGGQERGREGGRWENREEWPGVRGREGEGDHVL